MSGRVFFLDTLVIVPVGQELPTESAAARTNELPAEHIPLLPPNVRCLKLDRKLREIQRNGSGGCTCPTALCLVEIKSGIASVGLVVSTTTIVSPALVRSIVHGMQVRVLVVWCVARVLVIVVVRVLLPVFLLVLWLGSRHYVVQLHRSV